MSERKDIQIKQVIEVSEKKAITRYILEALPEWFEVESSREEYIRCCDDKMFFAAFAEDEASDGNASDGKASGDKAVGFLYLKETGKDTLEIAVMGVLKECHKHGVGRKLFEKAKETAAKEGYSFLQVKTVKMGMYEDYDQTNKFYQAVGFKELEVFPTLWDEANPCQIYVMAL